MRKVALLIYLVALLAGFWVGYTYIGIPAKRVHHPELMCRDNTHTYYMRLGVLCTPYTKAQVDPIDGILVLIHPGKCTCYAFPGPYWVYVVK